MSYPGNSALPVAIRQRILSTFRQTLDLAGQGSRHEATLGCDFILQMDPDFAPARVLQNRLAAGEGAIEVGDLREALPPDEPPPDEPVVERDLETEALFSDIDEDEFAAAAAAPETPEATVAAGDGAESAADELRRRLARRLEVRDFSGVLELARQAPSAITGEAEIARLVEAARARQEAAPYVQKFLDAARRSLDEGDRPTAGTMLEKARTLDPTHPGLSDLVARLAALPPPSAAAAEPEGAGRAPGALSGLHDGESADRIASLLADGQKAFEATDYQGAIDAWSRIFLVDIDHAEASRRIEEARRLKAERERRVEEVFHEATDKLESGDLEAALAGFQRVVEMEPGHLAAQEQLDRLGDGRRPAGARPPARPRPSARAGLPAADALEGDGDEGAPLKEEILVPPDDATAPMERRGGAPERPSVVAVAEGGPRRRFLVLGAAVLVVVAAAAAVVFLYRDRIFPNASETAVPTAESVDPIARATRLHEGGKSAMAISQLRRLPPSDPHYEEAQALISQWEASGQTPTAPAPTGPTTEELSRRNELMAEAGQAASRHRFLDAEELLDRAAAIVPLDESEAALRAHVERAVAPYSSEIALFRGGEYERALPSLWRLYEAEPGSTDLRRLIVDSYYNLAVRDLQRNDAKGAVQKLDEAAKLEPADPEIARHRRFAQAYEDRDKDLQYRIYVKYLPLR